MATAVKVIKNVYFLSFRKEPTQSLLSCTRRQISKPPVFKRTFSSSEMAKTVKIAIIGQSVFATDVYNLIRKNGHTVVGVFTVPDKNGREVRHLDKTVC